MRARESDRDLDNKYKREWRAKKVASGHYGYCPVCNNPLGRNEKDRLSDKTRVCKDCNWGENHQGWVGRGFKNHDGYVVIRIGKKQTRLEHRYVMEQHLGRELFEDETVHHKNGVRDDNRIENLELWVGAPRRGIATDDAVKWAKEIIWRYEGKEV